MIPRLPGGPKRNPAPIDVWRSVGGRPAGHRGIDLEHVT